MPALLEEGVCIPDSSWSNVQLGFGGDTLFSRRLSPSPNESGLHAASLEGFSQAGEVAWCIRERFLVQVELGSGQFSWRWQQGNSALWGRSESGLMWSCCGKLVLIEVQDTSLGVDVHAGGWDWMDGPATINGSPQFFLSQSTLRYWQVAVGLAQKIGLFSPYLGVAVNQTDFRVGHLATGKKYFSARYGQGPFLGCSLTKGSCFMLNLEWRGWFENAVSLSGVLRF